MSQLRLNAALIVGSVFIFLLAFVANELVFLNSEFVLGINWIYLPAGIRLLCTLLFGGAGAIGVMIGSWITCFFYFFPDDPVRSFAGGIASAAAPYLVYKMAQNIFGMRVSLANLTTRMLLILIFTYSVASPSLHHLWLLAHGSEVSLVSFSIMVLGDLLGTLVVVYAMKILVSFLPLHATNISN